MTRKKNSTFSGVSLDATDRGRPTFMRVIEAIAGDQALVFDRLTGENSEATTITHNGAAGRGSILGIPLVNQYIERSISVDDPAGSGGKDAGPGEVNLIAVPMFIPEGEGSRLIVEMFFTFGIDNPEALRMQFHAYDTSYTEAIDPVPLTLSPAPFGRTRAWARFELTSAATYVAFVRMSTDVALPGSTSSGSLEVGTLHSITVRPERGPVPVGRPPRDMTSDSLAQLWTPASTEGLGHRNFDTNLFGSLRSLNAYLTAGLDRNLNSLMEYMTGWPASGACDASTGVPQYMQEDQDSGGSADSTDPARSRFFAHTRSLYASEPECDFPVFIRACGAFKTDGGLVVEAANPPTYGMLDWFAPWPTTTTSTAIDEVMVHWPDFQTSSSRLKAAVLVGSDGAADVGTDWTAYITTRQGVSVKTMGTFTAVDGSNNYWLSTGSAISFVGDQDDNVQLKLEKTSGALEAIDQIVVLGWCMYFEP